MYVYAKARLPMSLKDVKHKYKLFKQSEDSKNPGKFINEKDGFPRAHTCTFELEVMEYTSKERFVMVF